MQAELFSGKRMKSSSKNEKQMKQSKRKIQATAPLSAYSWHPYMVLIGQSSAQSLSSPFRLEDFLVQF
jgi:hypothetical protein